ncbi:alpha/beta fold hydrolase [Rathayibacter tanaceti]|uniref:Alpha/beta fold hydrolase n=2 Tax=Rathayibacter tanaceti TaxID=1671680 RepID=A0A166HHR5_9MICO|nr:alpha/beta fold hydrolase [Rathayibacter tanaceti]KZX20615.1 Phospholipase YtpA [Rathayibacter tanaceti]QHC56357.1 alpha/beta fold hydrolase [Rathayibacter tanaceti]TCO34882.1 alpha-beta hydrolase superfamily lysophospholipase [Rathayibacter tanaceti]
MPGTAVDRTFEDAHGITIHYRWWPHPRPRAIVQIAHGVGEHSGRYVELAEALVAAGYAVAADDHRGHGRTGLEQHGGDPSRLGLLGPGGLRATEAAIRRLTCEVAAESAGVPIVLLGHSWGSLMAQRIVDRHSTDYAALVLSGTAYRLPGYMNAGDLARRHRVPGGLGLEWLSRDEDVWQRFHDDPLTFTTPLAKRIGPVETLRLLGRPARRGAPALPLLLLVGTDDTLGGERSVRALAHAYRRRAGYTDVSVRVYPEARHELFQELNRADVTADLVEWLDERFAGPARA